jgi:hypothetical protein
MTEHPFAGLGPCDDYTPPTRPKVDAILQGANQQLGAISETKPAWYYRTNPL